MKLLPRLVTYLAVIVLVVSGGAQAQSGYTHGVPTASYITVHNETATMVWITAYSPRLGGGKIEGSWPVQAHSENTHGLRATIVDVRAEIDAHPCSGANRLDSQLGTHRNGTDHNGHVAYALVGFVRYASGHCTFTT